MNKAYWLTLPLLSTLFFLPLFTALCAALLPRFAKHLALTGISLCLALSGVVVGGFEATNSDFQWQEQYAWLPSINSFFHLGVDGLSLWFLPATNLLFAAIVLRTWRQTQLNERRHLPLLLVLLSATLGVFMALDTLFFFCCWELTLIPLYFLLGQDRRMVQRVAEAAHSAQAKRQAASKYFFLMLLGGIPLLFAFILLAISASGQGTPSGQETITTNLVFSLPRLMEYTAAYHFQLLVFMLFVLGFAAKIPLVPLHTWLPELALASPAPVLAMLAGLKLGAYGLLRFAIPLAHEAAVELHWLLAGLATVGVLYGAVTALNHSNLKAILACSSVSHVGLVVLGIAALSPQGLQGSVLLLLSFSLASGGLYLLLDAIEQRTGSCDLHVLGGIADTWPRLAAFFLLFVLAGLGLPGTLGFPAELGILLAALQTHSGAGLAALFGLVVGAAASLFAYRNAFFGTPGTAIAQQSPAIHQRIPDLPTHDLVWVLPFALLLLITGLFPELLLGAIRASSEVWGASR